MSAARPAVRPSPAPARFTAAACLAVVLVMTGAAFAAVPLYGMFCKATGFGGTPVVRADGPTAATDRKIRIGFDTNVAPGFGWSFVPEVRHVDATIGETQTVFFRVKNHGDRPSTGISAFNVQPGQAGAFFVKMKCFCFEEQTLGAGETMSFPVVFYIDPAIAQDRTLDALSNVTLSYTYFASKDGQPTAAADRIATSSRL